MKNFVIYKHSGEIKRTGSCMDADFSFQAEKDELIIEGEANFGFSYVEEGRVINMPPKPSEFHEFDYATKQWFDPRTQETQWPIVRAERNRLLQESDWTQLPDVPLATKTAWAEYRQALRDVTLQPDPFTIIWPTKPE